MPDREICVTRSVITREEAVARKLDRLRCLVFGVPTVRFDVTATENVMVPYRFYVYDFIVRKRVLPFRAGDLSRKGRVAVVFDCNEAHPFECDTDETRLDFCVRALSEADGLVMAESLTPAEARERTETYIQNKILRRLYAGTGALTLLEERLFLRPAVRLGVRYAKSDVINARFAYTDAYGVESEHILGLKVRIGG